MERYWELILKDGSRYEIPPDAVATINRRMAAQQPINLRTATIPYNEIKTFQQTSKPYGVPLLDAAAQAFKEPMYFEKETPYGYTEKVMEAKWVKKDITNREWTRYYGALPGYRRLAEHGGIVTVAFLLPVQDINLQKVDYCSDDEVRELTNG